MIDTRTPTLGDRLTMQLTVAEPDQLGGLCVFPLIADRRPTLEYLAFGDERSRGVQIKEVAGSAQVGDLVVHNPLELPVLLYEGEEVHGAQQDRTIDVSVLVPAGKAVRVPVSCVEQGRWDGRRHAEPFAPAPHTAYPELRRLKNEQVRERLAAGAEPRAAQGEVWREVAARSARHGARSATGALRDVFELRRETIGRARAAITTKCSQVGMLAAIGGRFVVLDYVSDADAFASLHDRLVAGYALDALDIAAAPAPSLPDARDFLALLLDAGAVGHGATLTFEFGQSAGTALAAADELVTITAFSGS
jgi:hypothetical protein